jgi:hypothetical protein
MRFWARGNTRAGHCSGFFFTLSREGLKRALWGLLLISTLATAQTPRALTPKRVAAQRVNELTLAGLRPGRDAVKRAKQQYEGYWIADHPGEANAIHICGSCTGSILRIEADSNGIIQQIVVTEGKDVEKVQLRNGMAFGTCADYGEGWPRAGGAKSSLKSPWITGHKIGLHSSVPELLLVYGEPDSRSPSTKDGQPLELWYYAFDWAGPDIPQVMEVLCTKEKDGQPGRVVEITLAAPSL